jgi:hypothetical protein
LVELTGAAAQDAEHDMICARLQLFTNPGGDGVGITPADEVIDEVVAQGVDVLFGESHSSEVGPVPADLGQEGQWAAGRLAGLRRVSLKDDELVDDKRAVGPERVPGGCGVRRRDKQGDGSGTAFSRHFELARTQGRQDPSICRHRRRRGVKFVQVGV